MRYGCALVGVLSLLSAATASAVSVTFTEGTISHLVKKLK